jgi:hypothetical protein
MKLSNRVDANAVTITTGRSDQLEQVSPAVAGLILCETLWADGSVSRLSDTLLAVENDLGHRVHFNASAETLDAMLTVIPSSEVPGQNAAARGMMAIFGVEDEDDVAVGLSLPLCALKPCLLAHVGNPHIGFKRIAEVLRRPWQ